MKKENQRPYLRKYHKNEWVFVHPSSIDNEKVHEEFWDAVDQLDYDDENAERIFKALISKHPYYIDAYNHLSLAFRNLNKPFESLLTAEKSYNIGKGCLPDDFDCKENKLIWSDLDNRPFLRACQIYGLECHYHKDYETAIKIYRENLNLNEDDHQGIRYLLLETYFASKKYEDARLLLNTYPDDHSIEFTFGDVALLILENKVERANEKIKEAVKTNAFFVSEVIKDKHTKPKPFRLPGEPHFDAGIPLGSVQQAFDYWTRNKELYKIKEVIEYFKEKKAEYSL